MIKKILLVIAITLSASSISAQSAVDRPLITVTGQAEIMVVPDEVAFSLRVVTMEKELNAATVKNDQVVKSLMALAQKYQIPPRQVQTGHISMAQRFSDEEVTKKPPVFLGYTVTKRVAIVLGDVSKAEDLLADIFKSGITNIDDVDFRTTQLRKYKDQARAMAMKAAQEKATALTRQIGQTIGKAYSIHEQGPAFGGSPNVRNSIGFVTATSSNDESTIALGQISITAHVVVSFELK
ncbi:MAG TPA: SIMPL domain-containing protein [Pyrinomonadaceae bacterium]|nr:SIMPL domain-containing protein [Pyrinomonadaceae bacterium]